LYLPYSSRRQRWSRRQRKFDDIADGIEGEG